PRKGTSICSVLSEPPLALNRATVNGECHQSEETNQRNCHEWKNRSAPVIHGLYSVEARRVGPRSFFGHCNILNEVNGFELHKNQFVRKTTVRMIGILVGSPR